MKRFNQVASAAFLSLSIIGAGGALIGVAGAQSDADPRAKVNRNVVGVMAGSMSGTDMTLANDLGLAFSDGYDLRVVAMVGIGSVRDVEDLLYLRGIDMAIVQQDVIDFMVQNDVYPGIHDHVRLVAPLSVDQFHVLASNDIRTIEDLAGKKVNYGPTDRGTFMTSSVVFDSLGIDIEITTFPHKIALEKLRSGKISAMMRASGKPVSIIEEVQPGEPFHLLAVPQKALAETYGKAVLTAADYPALIAPGEEVQTVAVANALVGYNWPPEHRRGKALERFVNRFFGEYDKLKDSAFHESWQNIDIALEVPGLERYWAAENALQRLY
jgi:TRAP transporter TAXI family solute receptor